MKINVNKAIMNAVYIYILFPVILFFIGWLKLYIAIPLCIILGICYYKILNNKDMDLFQFRWEKKEVERIFFIICIVAIWVYLSGIGSLVYQNLDHRYRNAIFEVLVDYKWPVITELPAQQGTRSMGLIYYIGFWLPAALVGKYFGLTAGYCFQTIWAFIGVILFYYLVCVYRKKISVWPLVVFIFMSGLDAIGMYMLGSEPLVLDGVAHLEWWATGLQFSSFTTQLFWVFNQAIPAWIIFLLLLMQNTNRHIVFLLGCTLLPSTLPFVGMLPFFLYIIFSRQYEGCVWGHKEWWKKFYKDTFTFENILGGGSAGIISFLYLIGNISAQQVGAAATPSAAAGNTVAETATGIINKGNLSQIMVVLIFIILEVLVYWLLVYRYNKKSAFLYIILGWLFICPWIRVGVGSDFCMRASIPALVMLYLLVVETLEKAYSKKDLLTVWSLVIVLLLGSITVCCEIRRTTLNTFKRYEEGIVVFAESVSAETILQGGNFAGSTEAGIFFKYLARK